MPRGSMAVESPRPFGRKAPPVDGKRTDCSALPVPLSALKSSRPRASVLPHPHHHPRRQRCRCKTSYQIIHSPTAPEREKTKMGEIERFDSPPTALRGGFRVKQPSENPKQAHFLQLTMEIDTDFGHFQNVPSRRKESQTFLLPKKYRKSWLKNHEDYTLLQRDCVLDSSALPYTE